jgi:YVTN family beta-propeller protein
VTVPVGNGPATLTILRDGSRVYVANQKDSTVSVVSLTSYQVLATIPGDRPSHFDCLHLQHSLRPGLCPPSDQPYMSVIRTDTDQVAASIQLDGTGVDVHTSAQSVAANSARQARLRMPSMSARQRQRSALWVRRRVMRPLR